MAVVSAGFYHGWYDVSVVAKGFEILALFGHASYVITDTFHGTILAIKNRKPFVSLVHGTHRMGSNANKLGFLLRQVGLEDRIMTDCAQVGTHLQAPIDYHVVHRQLATLRGESMDFLAAAMAADKKK